MPQKTRFTIYDAMDNAGLFSSNPANPGSRDNDGNAIYAFAEYPKMLYHPEGEEKIIVPAEIVVTPLGPRENNEQRELIHQIVNNKAEEDDLVEQGWFAHPAQAMESRIKQYIAQSKLTEKEEKALLAKIPKIAAIEAKAKADQVAELVAEIERLKAERDKPEETPASKAASNAPKPTPNSLLSQPAT